MGPCGVFVPADRLADHTNRCLSLLQASGPRQSVLLGVIVAVSGRRIAVCLPLPPQLGRSRGCIVDAPTDHTRAGAPNIETESEWHRITAVYGRPTVSRRPATADVARSASRYVCNDAMRLTPPSGPLRPILHGSFGQPASPKLRRPPSSPPRPARVPGKRCERERESAKTVGRSTCQREVRLTEERTVSKWLRALQSPHQCQSLSTAAQYSIDR
jgi:hypothetical protein